MALNLTNRKSSKILLLLIVACIIRKIFLSIYRRYKKFPPGPVGIPLFGSFFYCIDLAGYAAYLGKHYGPITMINIGFKRFVFIHDLKYINEVTKHKDAQDRGWDNSLLFPWLKPSELPTPVVAQKYWWRKRKMFQSIMISQLSSKYMNNVFNKIFESHVYQSLNNKCINNKLWFVATDTDYIQCMALWHAVYGTYIPYDNVAWKQLIQLMHDSKADGGLDLTARFFGLQHILPNSILNKIQINTKALMHFIEEQAYIQLGWDESVFDFVSQEFETKWSEYFEDECNLNCMLAKMIVFHRNNVYSTKVSKHAILFEIMNVFAGGVAAMCNTAEYGIILLAKYVFEQELIANELVLTFGNDIKMEHITFSQNIHKLHYLRAFLYETLRISSVTATGIGRTNPAADIWVNNGKYRIPKNSVIMSDIPTANRYDPYWLDKTNGKPMSLCLDVWLNENKQFKLGLNKDKMVTFSLGPRNCAGEGLALRCLYLMFVKLLLKYQFILPDPNIKIKQKFELTYLIEPKIGVFVKKRNSYNE